MAPAGARFAHALAAGFLAVCVAVELRSTSSGAMTAKQPVRRNNARSKLFRAQALLDSELATEKQVRSLFPNVAPV